MKPQSFFTEKLTKIDLGYIKTGDLFKKIDDDCERMKSHPILGHIHDHKKIVKYQMQKLKITWLYIIKNPDAKVIITLGGSTSDGFYKNFSAGKTYPYYLEINFVKRDNCRVINAGTGGYGSSKRTSKAFNRNFPIKTRY